VWVVCEVSGFYDKAGQSHECYIDDQFAVLRRPYRANWLLLASFPTLKRGANHHCASGAIEIGSNQVNNLDSCDCPVWQRRQVGPRFAGMASWRRRRLIEEPR